MGNHEKKNYYKIFMKKTIQPFFILAYKKFELDHL
jgi:hypothetical protein